MFQSDSAKDKENKKFAELASDYASLEESVDRVSEEKVPVRPKASKLISPRHRERVLERNPRLMARALEP